MSRAAALRRPSHSATCDDGEGFVGRGLRQRGAGAAAERLELREQQPEDFGDHPGADGEVWSAQAEHHEGGRQSDDRGAEAGQRNGQQRIDAEQDQQREQAVGAEPDKGLLADRDQPGKAGEQVPVLRQAQHGEHEEQVLDQRPAGDERHGEQQRDERRPATAAIAEARVRVVMR